MSPQSLPRRRYSPICRPPRLTALAHRLDLPSGQCLFAAGDTPSHFHLVVTGRLRVKAGD